MRSMACVAAALMFAFALGCNDRDREDTASRIDTTAEEAGDEIREGANDVEKAAEETGEEVREGGNDVEEAAKDVGEEFGHYTYDRRAEFRRDIRERLDSMDAELAQLERDAKKGADQARIDAVAAAREARLAVDKEFSRLGDATAANWDELKERVSESVDSARRKLQALRPDAKPMGGTGGPS